MINYEHLHYWLDTMENIILLQKLLTDNKIGYNQTHNIRYLEYIIECAKELLRLEIEKEKHYQNIFNNTPEKLYHNNILDNMSSNNDTDPDPSHYQ